MKLYVVSFKKDNGRTSFHWVDADSPDHATKLLTERYEQSGIKAEWIGTQEASEEEKTAISEFVTWLESKRNK